MWHEGDLYKGTPYIKSMVNGMDIEVDYYCGRFIKRHINGFAYSKLSIIPIIGNGKEDMWISWKSNLAGYEYIEPDDELNLQSEDITFEICTEIPENLAQEFYAKSTQEIDCNKWIAFINDESHYPKKSKGKTVVSNFCFEIAPDCNYQGQFSGYYDSLSIQHPNVKTTKVDIQELQTLTKQNIREMHDRDTIPMKLYVGFQNIQNLSFLFFELHFSINTRITNYNFIILALVLLFILCYNFLC